jgi:hypothetical protein
MCQSIRVNVTIRKDPEFKEVLLRYTKHISVIIPVMNKKFEGNIFRKQLIRSRI